MTDTMFDQELQGTAESTEPEVVVPSQASGDIQKTTPFSEVVRLRKEHACARIRLAKSERTPERWNDNPWPEWAGQLGSPPARNIMRLRNVSDALLYRQGELEKSNEDQKKDATGIAQDYARSGDRDSFQMRIQQKRQEGEKRAIEENNRFWDKVEETGANLSPEQQDQLLTVADRIQAFAQWLWAQVAQFFVDLFNKAMSWIKEAAKKVGEWFANAANEITGFFRGLFG